MEPIQSNLCHVNIFYFYFILVNFVWLTDGDHTILQKSVVIWEVQFSTHLYVNAYTQVKQEPFFPSFTESIYRRGARRWRKFYYASGHAFQAKRFNRVRPDIKL